MGKTIKKVVLLLNQTRLITVLSILLFGSVSLYASTYFNNSSVARLVLLNVGAAAIAAAIATWILSTTSTKISKVVGDEVEKIQKKNDESFKRMREQFDDLFNVIFEKLDVLREINQIGIIRAFRRRHNNESYKKTLINEFNNVRSDEDVFVMSSSLRDFFGGSRIDEELLTAFTNMVKAGANIKILLLDPTSDAAAERARVEEPYTVKEEGYVNSSLFTDIRLVSDFLFNLPKERFKGSLRDKFIQQVKVRYYPFDPTTHMHITKRVTFIEQYHRGGSTEIHEELKKRGQDHVKCFGGFAPIFMLDNSCNFAQLLNSHFLNIWDSLPVTSRELRDNNYPEIIKSFENLQSKLKSRHQPFRLVGVYQDQRSGKQRRSTNTQKQQGDRRTSGDRRSSITI